MRNILPYITPRMSIKNHYVLLAIMTYFIVMFALFLSLFINEWMGISSSMKPEDRQVVANFTPPAKNTEQQMIPARLVAPSVDLGVTIQDSTINAATNDWPLSEDEAHYANFTAKLGDSRGTMLIYGHNTRKVMNKTNDLKIGDNIYLIDANGKNWKFRYVDQKTIRPTEVAFIYEETPFRVVMFTCYGWNDEFRRLMYFTPAE